MTAQPKSGQGMRQPQLGGVQSRLELAAPRPICASRHTRTWRKSPEHPWVCAVCHPSPFPDDEIETRENGRGTT